MRFEYFLLPAVAVAAGLGAEDLARRSPAPAPLIPAAWTIVFGLQVLIGVLLLHDRFEIIAVIMEFPRWPFPLK